MGDLDQLRNEVFGLYEKQEYERALEVAREAVDDFPANASYWIACLLAVTNRPAEALDALDKGLAKGGWWTPLMLARDPDLESIRGSDHFAKVAAESERVWRQAFRPEPDIHIYPPTTSPSGVLLVALHGSAGEAAPAFAHHWMPACEQGALVVVPQSSQPHTPEGGWSWVDDDRTDRDLRLAYDKVFAQHAVDPTRVVLCGFSQGARVAVDRSLSAQPFTTCGFIAVAPALRDHPLDAAVAQAKPGLRGVIVVGADDVVLDSARAIHDEGTNRGLDWQLQEVPDLGHEFPKDFGVRLKEALQFLTADSE